MSGQASNNQGGIFINGKEQAIELLKALSQKEKNNILSKIQLVNPTLAMELNRKSIEINSIENLGQHELTYIFNNVSPQILGLALKNSSRKTQRSVLKLAQRSYAEEAYKILISDIPNEKAVVRKASEKVKNLIIKLIK